MKNKVDNKTKARKKVIMRKKLLELHENKIKNGYDKYAEQITDIIKEYKKKELSDISKRKLQAMCNQRAFGNLYIKEFKTPYEWWNYLNEIIMNIE